MQVRKVEIGRSAHRQSFPACGAERHGFAPRTVDLDRGGPGCACRVSTTSSPAARPPPQFLRVTPPACKWRPSPRGCHTGRGTHPPVAAWAPASTTPVGRACPRGAATARLWCARVRSRSARVGTHSSGSFRVYRISANGGPRWTARRTQPIEKQSLAENGARTTGALGDPAHPAPSAGLRPQGETRRHRLARARAAGRDRPARARSHPALHRLDARPSSDIYQVISAPHRRASTIFTGSRTVDE